MSGSKLVDVGRRKHPWSGTGDKHPRRWVDLRRIWLGPLQWCWWSDDRGFLLLSFLSITGFGWLWKEMGLNRGGFMLNHCIQVLCWTTGEAAKSSLPKGVGAHTDGGYWAAPAPAPPCHAAPRSALHTGMGQNCGDGCFPFSYYVWWLFPDPITSCRKLLSCWGCMWGSRKWFVIRFTISLVDL